MKRTLASEAPVLVLLAFIDSPNPFPGYVTQKRDGAVLLCTSPALYLLCTANPSGQFSVHSGVSPTAYFLCASELLPSVPFNWYRTTGIGTARVSFEI